MDTFAVLNRANWLKNPCFSCPTFFAALAVVKEAASNHYQPDNLRFVHFSSAMVQIWSADLLGLVRNGKCTVYICSNYILVLHKATVNTLGRVLRFMHQ